MRLSCIKTWFEKDKLKNVPKMVLAVITMGICVATLKLTSFGPDPCSALHYGMARICHLSLGTYQLIVNTVLFIIVLSVDGSLLGLGSFGNMILVGYSADATTWLIRKLFHVDALMIPVPRILIMLVSLAVFVLAAAVYMNCDLGTAPYDAISFLIHKKLITEKGRNVNFRVTRMIYDGIVTIAAVIVKGEYGIVTVLMVFTLGPTIDFVGKKLFSK